MLEVEALAGGYGEIKVLHDLSISADRGKITALVGANGAGKTTLMRSLAGLLPIRQGRILFEGQDLAGSTAAARLAQGMALVPEGRLVFPAFTVEETLKIGAYGRAARAGWRARAEEMYRLFPRLHERRRARAGTLSGGEQQMLALARGLMARPRLLLLDEPSLGLAPVMAGFLFSQIARLREAGLTIILVEQNVKESLSLADRGYVLENGRIVADDSGAALLTSPSVRASFLGL